MRKIHMYIGIICFLTALIALYFGSSIFNAGDNYLITHLNEQDLYRYNSLEEIPILTAKAVTYCGFLLLVAFGLQIYTYIKVKNLKIKRIITALFVVYFILICFSIFVILDPSSRDFFSYGMIWVLLSLILVFGNGFIILLNRK